MLVDDRLSKSATRKGRKPPHRMSDGGGDCFAGSGRGCLAPRVGGDGSPLRHHRGCGQPHAGGCRQSGSRPAHRGSTQEHASAQSCRLGVSNIERIYCRCVFRVAKSLERGVAQFPVGRPSPEVDFSDQAWICRDPGLLFEADHRLVRFQLVELLSQRSRLLMFKASSDTSDIDVLTSSESSVKEASKAIWHS